VSATRVTAEVGVPAFALLQHGVALRQLRLLLREMLLNLHGRRDTHARSGLNHPLAWTVSRLHGPTLVPGNALEAPPLTSRCPHSALSGNSSRPRATQGAYFVHTVEVVVGRKQWLRAGLQAVVLRQRVCFELQRGTAQPSQLVHRLDQVHVVHAAQLLHLELFLVRQPLQDLHGGGGLELLERRAQLQG
jgi:hypothetical protein